VRTIAFDLDVGWVAVTAAGDSDREGGADAEHPQQPDPLDVDAAFAAIIAGWADDAPGEWPAEEDVAGGRHRRSEDPQAPAADGPDAVTGAARPGPGLPDDPDQIDPLDLFDQAPKDRPLIPSIELPLNDPLELSESTEGYAPPEPPPLPRGDLLSRLAWAGVIGGPIFLLITVIAWRTAPQLLVLAAIAAFVGGFISLVARMPKHRSDDDDDGAVV
jgi:hypothetical protein